MSEERDYGMLVIVMLIVTIAIWLLLMPVVPAIASATLHRFHLRTPSFAAWAMQFPIPAMYNFANRYKVEADQVSLGSSPETVPLDGRMVNHFPARIFTFADGRYLHLRHGEDRWLTIESSYRGQGLRTRFHAEPAEDFGFDLHRLDGKPETQ
ncbi:MAG: hypothetical protein GY904_26200 [Planctomycetaceae bacterium]|nr:hypothetical protein [Planctomycetaceae bacterium]